MQSISYLSDDMLQVLFAYMFRPTTTTTSPPAADEATCLSCATAHQLWVSLRLVCKRWNKILIERAVPLHIKIAKAMPPHDMLHRFIAPSSLHRLDMTLLETDPSDPRGDVAIYAAQQRLESFFTNLHTDSWSYNDGNDDNIPCCWKLGSGALSLTSLTLNAGFLGDTFQAGDLYFNAGQLEELIYLKNLSLSGFHDYILTKGLPQHLNTLHLSYRQAAYHRKFIELELPVDMSIDVLDVDLDSDLSSLCIHMGCEELAAIRDMNITAGSLFLSFPTIDMILLNEFYLPYVEGDYIPPHIFSDMHQVFRSNSAAEKSILYLFDEICSNKSLKKITVEGKCAKSVKMVPRADTDKTSARWLHGVMNQSLQSVYGVNSNELAAKLPYGLGIDKKDDDGVGGGGFSIHKV